MALAVGNRVYSAQLGGLMEDEPLVGWVVKITGSQPEALVLVHWSNGVMEPFPSTDESASGLVVFTDDPESLKFVGKPEDSFGRGGMVVRLFALAAGGRKKLVRTNDGLWGLKDF